MRKKTIQRKCKNDYNRHIEGDMLGQVYFGYLSDKQKISHADHIEHIRKTRKYTINELYIRGIQVFL